MRSTLYLVHFHVLLHEMMGRTVVTEFASIYNSIICRVRQVGTAELIRCYIHISIILMIDE